MGFKALKQFYRIGHSVHVTDEGICIGSPYVHNLIVIGLDGVLKKRHDREGSNDDLDRYMREFDEDPVRLKRIVAAPDAFDRSLPVFTWKGGEIVEAACEEYGWPNVTHQGRMMYENTFFKEKADAVRAAKEDAAAGVKWRLEAVARSERELADQRRELDLSEANLAKLNADFP
jgi:hypothetical protein